MKTLKFSGLYSSDFLLKLDFSRVEWMSFDLRPQSQQFITTNTLKDILPLVVPLKKICFEFENENKKFLESYLSLYSQYQVNVELTHLFDLKQIENLNFSFIWHSFDTPSFSEIIRDERCLMVIIHEEDLEEAFIWEHIKLAKFAGKKIFLKLSDFSLIKQDKDLFSFCDGFDLTVDSKFEYKYRTPNFEKIQEQLKMFTDTNLEGRV